MSQIFANASFTEWSASLCFVMALVHTFSVKWFQNLAAKYPEGTILENFYHLLGEIEIVFGTWAALFLFLISIDQGGQTVIEYLESCNFTEPAFVFVILVVCSTKPVLDFGSNLLTTIARGFSFITRVSPGVSLYAVCLTVGPLLGSFITEPAAMTITALILVQKFFQKNISDKLMYATLGLLFVNISIGGTLTPYAAPPVLMVARHWNWDIGFMLQFFGWKAALAITISTFLVCFQFRKELSLIKLNDLSNASPKQGPFEPSNSTSNKIGNPFARASVTAVHLLFLVLIVVTAHHLVVFGGLFLFFIGLTAVTKEYQDELKLREGLLVSFFLGGLVVLGGPQRWWLEPILENLNQASLFLGSIGLTAIVDNAALTFLGAQVPNLPESSRFALVAGAVVGGGLTVIANAPNPAGYGILNPSFKPTGISPAKLFLSALPPTVISAAIFWFL